jgi:hypothetical protein
MNSSKASLLIYRLRLFFGFFTGPPFWIAAIHFAELLPFGSMFCLHRTLLQFVCRYVTKLRLKEIHDFVVRECCLVKIEVMRRRPRRHHAEGRVFQEIEFADWASARKRVHDEPFH